MYKPALIPILSLLLFSCSGPGSYKKAENAADAGREFIRASLDGDYRKAAFFLLKDSTNQLMFDKLQSDYQRLSPEEKESYRQASIRPVAIVSVNDSITTYKYYQSSNPSDTTTLRIVKQEDEWLVDLKSIIKI